MDTSTSKMGVGGLLKKLLPFVLPYRWLLILTLVLTFVGSLMAQVNAVVLDRAVDAINALLHVEGGFEWGEAARLLLTVSAVLLGKEVLAAVITFGQRIFGEKIRINVSRDLSLRVVDRILQFRMAFFSNEGNEPGKLQTRIDRGVMSLSNTVKNFFIDILPLFTSAVMALVLMFAANVYVGLVALAIIPIYFFITARQGVRMKGWRRRVFGTHQALNHGIMNIIESMGVIKSFNRERLEADRQAKLQNDSTDQQMATRRISFLFEGLKTFVEQIGTVLIIILTAYLVLIDYPGMTIGKIMYHVLLFSNVSAPIRQLHRIYDDLNDALIYAEVFFGILEADGEVEPTGSHRPPMVRGAFELKNVEFTYSNGTHATRDLSMTIEPGKTTALVGLIGAGKTTIVNLLDKFYAPDSGSITLDGVPLKEWDTQ
ncbi:MAG: ABC transporter ATP-binding protein, partial [Bacteroidales bacterium]|nr:ABC transporter ATP-binding protein [Bacteroidales bacterium]